MPNKEFRLTSDTNITFNSVVQGHVDEYDWAEMTEQERMEEMAEVIADHINIHEVN